MELTIAILAFTVGGFVLSYGGTCYLFYNIVKNPVPRNFSNADIDILANAVIDKIGDKYTLKDVAVMGDREE